MVLTVKSYYGGFNALSFSDDWGLLGLAGQDDCATIVSLENKGYIRLFQHTSFVSRVLFVPQVTRVPNGERKSVIVVSGSLDCKVGMFHSELEFLHREMVSTPISCLETKAVDETCRRGCLGGRFVQRVPG